MPNKAIPRKSSSYEGETSTAFDQDFNRLAGPKLLNLVIATAYHVQVGICAFSEAANCVLHHALQLGADRLSAQAFAEMLDWIEHEILARLDDPPGKAVLTADQIAAMIRLEV